MSARARRRDFALGSFARNGLIGVRAGVGRMFGVIAGEPGVGDDGGVASERGVPNGAAADGIEIGRETRGGTTGRAGAIGPLGEPGASDALVLLVDGRGANSIGRPVGGTPGADWLARGGASEVATGTADTLGVA